MIFVFFACGTAGSVAETPLLIQGTENTPDRTGGIAEEIRFLVEEGTPPALLRTLDLIRSRDLGASEFGRTMNAVTVALMRKIYPDIPAVLPASDPPLTHQYSRILRDAERGLYTPPQQNSADYLEYVLPFLALFSETGGRTPSAERFLIALPDLRQGKELNPYSVLAPYFLGVVYERSGRPQEAAAEYTRAYEISRECYPAVLGLARIMDLSGQRREGARLLEDLVVRYPDNTAIKRQLALAYYHNGEWSLAESAIAEILQRNTRDGEFILMRAHVFVEQGQFLQAQAPLDLYASIDSNNRMYLFLRARVQAEGYRNRTAALNYLRSILRTNPNDDEVAVYAARLLMESSRAEDQSEGRTLMRNLLNSERSSPAIIGLALQDAIRREAWREARPYAERLLAERRSSEDLVNAYKVERGLGNNAAALAYAREIYERDPSNQEGVVAYISALIDTGRQDEASRMIESRIAGVPGGPVKSGYYYLRSRLRGTEELVMNDLRSSLFEDPRNLNALIGMFEIYHRRKDEHRAVYYLKQALALAPDNPLLKRYEVEYRAALGSAF
jgi:tetratricopeptide (TPR) repeat protein